MAKDQVHVAIEAMERAIQDRRIELARLETQLHQLRATAPDYHAPAKTDEWTGLSITDAAVRYLIEQAAPMETKAIATALRDKGVRTTSRNFTATVYSTLANNKNKFERQDKRWAVIVPRNRGASKAFKEVSDKKSRLQ